MSLVRPQTWTLFEGELNTHESWQRQQQQQYNNYALFALITKRHIYIASDKNYSNLRNTHALSRARRIKEPCGFRVTPLPFSCKTK